VLQPVAGGGLPPPVVVVLPPPVVVVPELVQLFEVALTFVAALKFEASVE
jgi:hypothetical protein